MMHGDLLGQGVETGDARCGIVQGSVVLRTGLEVSLLESIGDPEVREDVLMLLPCCMNIEDIRHKENV